MNKRKRDDGNDEETKKILRHSPCLNVTDIAERCSISYFEDLLNGIILEVFEYLDWYYVYEGFFNLNTRYRNLLMCSTVSLNIGMMNFSKSTLQNYYSNFLKPNKHRVQSLHLSDPFTIDFFSSSTESILEYSKLQNLRLAKVESKSLEHLLHHLPSLPNLSSLSIHISQTSNKMKIYNLIFQFPVLKYCKISFAENVRLGLLPFSTDSASPIEDLVIVGVCNLNELNVFLSYVRQLRRLSVNLINGIYEENLEKYPFVLHHLTSVSLQFENVDFFIFEQFAQCHFGHVQVLSIVTNYDWSYLEEKHWEQMIVLHIPCLRVFDLQVLRWPMADTVLEFAVNRFNSEFWSERQWFFTCEFYCRSDGYSNRIFYSTQPYRRKSFILSSTSDSDKRICQDKIVFDSVRHVLIEDEKVLDNCSKFFPNVNELTLTKTVFQWIPTDRICQHISLIRLTKLTIAIPRYRLEDLIAMLHHTPNIHTLIFQSKLPSASERCLVSFQNQIENLSILQDYSLKNIKILLNLCPQLKHLTLSTSRRSLEPTVRFLLSEVKNGTCQLSSVCIVEVDAMWTEKLKALLETKDSRDRYSIKIIDQTFFIWF